MGCADARLTSAVALGHDSRAAVVFLQEYRPTSGYYQKVACKCAQAFAARVIVSRPLWVVKVRQLVSELERDGWYFVGQVGSHRHFRHPTKGGKVTVPGVDGKELAKPTLASIGRHAQLVRKRR
jgi:predicted RNA binding protein YcfA (HicA-like mRNA interferase family)